MLTVLILVVFAVVVLVLVLLAVVVIAIRQEPRDAEMNVAPSLIAVVVRRLLGVYMRRPAPPADSHQEWPTTAWTETTSRPSGGRR